MLQPPVTEVSCGLRCMRAARCVAASESKKNAACLHRCIFLSETLAGGHLEVAVYVSRMPGVWRTQG